MIRLAEALAFGAVAALVVTLVRPEDGWMAGIAALSSIVTWFLLMTKRNPISILRGGMAGAIAVYGATWCVAVAAILPFSIVYFDWHAIWRYTLLLFLSPFIAWLGMVLTFPFLAPAIVGGMLMALASRYWRPRVD